MSVGQIFRNSFERILDRMGGSVLAHRQWGTPAQRTIEVRGMKNSSKNRPQDVSFQFLDRIDIRPGDVLQQKGAQDLWRVTDVEDVVRGDVYNHFEASVERMSGAPVRTPSAAQVVIHGSNYGGVQVASPHGVQHVTAEVLQVDENIGQLRTLISRLQASDLEKEEIALALDRLAQLARKPRSEEVVSKANEKLELVKSAFSVSKELATLSAPHIGFLAQALAR
jgi:hypothetical protein